MEIVQTFRNFHFRFSQTAPDLNNYLEQYGKKGGIDRNSDFQSIHNPNNPQNTNPQASNFYHNTQK